MPRVIHFEIHADDTERAKTFYTTVFGWHITKWDGPGEYYLIETGKQPDPGINGAMLKRVGSVTDDSVTAYVCTIDVDDFDTYKQKVLDNGGTMALEKRAVVEVGWVGYFKDTEGNVFGIMQSDASAK